jgi:L-rhamnose isomerase
MSSHLETIERLYGMIREQLQEMGIDTDSVLRQLEKISLSIHCWQGDDVIGSENITAGTMGGGIQVTGSYPGRARSMDELRQDLEKTLALLPGRHRVNLHAMYGDFNGKAVDRNEIEPAHFDIWLQWAQDHAVPLDFNATCFAHPQADSGWTLSHSNPEIREFWIEHVRRARKISAYFGEKQSGVSIHNLWIPDGSKDKLYSRKKPRTYLIESLNEIYKDTYPNSQLKDAVESKLFGIGSESYVTGSFEFYIAYALKNRLMVCLDMGHYHPTEIVADKISSILLFSDELLLHVSRGVRWDSDHIPILDDDVLEVAQELVRGDYLNRVYLALDFFDASINRIGAYILGARTVQKAILLALLEPGKEIKGAEERGDNFTRLALMEEAKQLPLGTVWDYFCLTHDVPPSGMWINDVKTYEHEVLLQRG